MEEFITYLPYIIPIILLHYGMAIYALVLIIRTKDTTSTLYKIIWGAVVLFIQIIGPIIYLVFGKRDR